jgi:hypothetical protein
MLLNEKFLHFVWQHGLLDNRKLHTIHNEKVEIVFPGYRNPGTGPDFSEARIRIGNRLWAGNVEIHLNASDWYAHHHETDKNYDSVILHVVYRYDMPVYNTYGVEIPVLELHDKILPGVYERFSDLSASNDTLKCKAFLPVDGPVWEKWKERLFIERLEQKVGDFEAALKKHTNDWEAVLFEKLLRYFGMARNTDAFEQTARHIGFQVFRKYIHNPEYTEALLLGVSGILARADGHDTYIKQLKSHYLFLKNKHNLTEIDTPVTHGRVRPANFPSVRLSQLAGLYYRHENLFNKIIDTNAIDELRKIFNQSVSAYWETHYFPGKPSVKRKKVLGKSFIDLLIINVVVPLRFAYAKYYGDDTLIEKTLLLAAELPAEKNNTVNIFIENRLPVRNAADSQAVIHLKKYYCNANNCINCSIGKNIVSGANNR